MKNILTAFALFALIGFAYSCNNSKASTSTKKLEVIDKATAKEYTSKYICPMHCAGSGSETAGTCPVCEMDYEINESYKGASGHDGHDHDSHEGHDHGSHDGHDHGSHEGHNH